MMKSWKAALLVGLALAGLPQDLQAGEGETGLVSLTSKERSRRWENDARWLGRFATQVDALREKVDAARSLWDRDPETPLTAEERAQALDLFAAVMDYEVALDTISTFHMDFWRLGAKKDPVAHVRHFLLAYTGYLIKVLLGATFVRLTEAKPQFEKLFDEGDPAHGLPKGAYAGLKWNVVHVEKVSALWAGRQYYKWLSKHRFPKLPRHPLQTELRRDAVRAHKTLKTWLKRMGPKMFAKNGLDIVKDGAGKAWFPLQKNVAEWMGDTRVRHGHHGFISEAQIAEAVKRSEPGDILVERRNWYLSNVGLPGFWPHAALYLGNYDELAAYFDAEPAVTEHFGQKFTEYLAGHHSEAWKHYRLTDPEGHTPRILEAMSEGVVFTSAEYSLNADYAGAMRPLRSKLDKAKALDRAFAFAGRPYDFDFDFYTDQSLVCSELVYKSYEPATDSAGLKIDLVEVVGRMTLPANELVRVYAEGRADAPLGFVWFLDGFEETNKAEWGDEAAFKASYTRPRWDVAQP